MNRSIASKTRAQRVCPPSFVKRCSLALVILIVNRRILKNCCGLLMEKTESDGLSVNAIAEGEQQSRSPSQSWQSYISEDLPRSLMESTDAAIRSARSLHNDSSAHLRSLQVSFLLTQFLYAFLTLTVFSLPNDCLCRIFWQFQGLGFLTMKMLCSRIAKVGYFGDFTSLNIRI